MLKLRAFILDEFIEEVLHRLQLYKRVHIVDIRKNLTRWENLPEPTRVDQEKRRWQLLHERVTRILSELKLKEDLGLIEQLFRAKETPTFDIGPEDDASLLGRADGLVDTVEKEIDQKVKRFELTRELLIEVGNDKMDLGDLRSTSILCVKLGKIPVEEIPLLEGIVQSKIGLASIYTTGKRRLKFMAIVSVAKFSDQIDQILASHRFQKIEIPEELTGTPSSSLGLMDSYLNNLLQTYTRQILALHDAISAKIDRLKAEEKLGQTKRVFILEGWIPEENQEEICKLISESAQGNAAVSVLPPDEPESEIPVLLKERKILGSFRILTEMYGMPMYNEIDPTPFLAVFFTMFVGLMSADIAIGLTLLVASILIRRGAGSRSKSMKDLSTILSCIGVSSVIFGVLMGEFMGGVLELPIIWISAADKPIEFLFIVIGVGMVHIVFGAILGLINNFYRKKFMEIIGNQLSTILLIAAASVFLSTGRFEFDGIGIAAYVMGIAGLVALILGKGASGLLELTRLLSNAISYVRILALNMATAWMSRTFLLLGGLLIEVYLIGPVLYGVLLAFSHLFLVFISAFATFAHSLRLHYVEFFGRFFIGGGYRFSPLTSERTYTIPVLKLEEKTQQEKEKQIG